MNRTELELLHNKIKSISTSEFEDWLEQFNNYCWDDGYEKGYEAGRDYEE